MSAMRLRCSIRKRCEAGQALGGHIRFCEWDRDISGNGYKVAHMLER
jgi:hypothetical protein